MTTYTAEALLREWWDLKLPIDPDFFAEKLGLKIVKEPLGYRSGYLDNDAKTIHVNCNEAEVRQRFTIAHELGHFCLGHGSAERNDIANFGKDYDPAKERAANQFAADLLMPPIALKVLIDKRKIRNPVELRNLLGVSASALNVRMTCLGYFL